MLIAQVQVGYVQHMRCSKCMLIYVCEISAQKSAAPYVIWLVRDHKHDFDVTRLASVLEKGAKIVQRHSIKVCRTFTQSISQKHFSENTITLYLRKIF